MGLTRQRIALAALLIASAASEANAAPPESCLDKINDAIKLANRMPASAGRASILTDIARAREARHEGDEAGCIEQIDETLAVLRQQRKSHAGA